MNNEFKKMQYLAGIKETKIGHPALIKFENLKIGDELIVKQNKRWDGDTFKVGDIYKITDVTEGWMLATGRMFYELEHVNGNNPPVYLYDSYMKEAVNSGVFGYHKKFRTNEAMILNPLSKNMIDDIILLDKKFVNKVSKISYDNNTQLRLMVEFYEKYEKYGIIDALDVDYDTLKEELVKQPYKSLVQLYKELELVMNKLLNIISEVKVGYPTIPNSWEPLDKEKLLSNIKHLRDEIKEGAEIIDGWEPKNKGIYDAVFLVKVNDQYYVEGWKDDEYQIQEGPFPDKRTARIELLKQIIFCMDYWHAILEVKVGNPVFKTPEGWNELEPYRFPGFLMFIRPEVKNNGEIIEGWITGNTIYDDVVLLVKNDNQYYVEGVNDGEYIIQEGPFPTEVIAKRKVLEVINDIIYSHNLNEIKVGNPTFTMPEGWNEDEDQTIEQDPELWGGIIVRSWWAPMNGDDEEHADRIFLVKNNNQYYIHYVYAFANDDYDKEGPFPTESKALSKILEAMKETMSYWNENDELINEYKVKNPISIDNFCNQHFDELQNIFGKISSKFTLATIAGIEVASAGTDEDDGIDISFDPEYLELANDYNDIEELEIAGRGVYVNNYLNRYLDDEDINEYKVGDPTQPNIVEFGDENIEEIKKLVGYEGDNILKTFEKTIDKDAAYAVFSRLINGINHKTIVIISFNPEFVVPNLIKTAKINKKTIYYVEV